MLLVLSSLLLLMTSGCVKYDDSLSLEAQLLEEFEAEVKKEENKIIKEVTENANKDVSSEKPKKENNQKEVVVKVIGKKNVPADWNEWRYEDWVGFSISITNNTNKTIRGVQGILDIQDVFGKSIIRLKADLLGISVDSGDNIIDNSMGLDINPFMDNHVKLYNLDLEDLIFEYTIEKVAFSDGTILDMD